MNLREALKQTTADFQAGNAVIWKSQPGIGKTDATKLLLENLRKMHPGRRVGLCRSFLAWQESVDAGGLPWKGERTINGKTYTITDPAMPSWYISTEGIPACEYDIVLMVLEEWGQGGIDTKKAFAPLLLEGGVGRYTLPQGSPRIALTNVDARDGVTKEMDFVIGRRVEYSIHGDVRVWIEDFADKPYELDGKKWQTLPVFKAWAQQRSEILFEDKPKVQGPWCNPRTLCMADRYTQVVMEQNNGEIPIDNYTYVESLSGKIGMNATQSVISTMKFKLELPSYEEVIADPSGTPVPTKADILMLMAYELAGWCLPEHVGECITYISRMPKDYAVTFISALLRRNYKAFIETPPMKAWVAKNAALMALVVGLS